MVRSGTGFIHKVMFFSQIRKAGFVILPVLLTACQMAGNELKITNPVSALTSETASTADNQADTAPVIIVKSASAQTAENDTDTTGASAPLLSTAPSTDDIQAGAEDVEVASLIRNPQASLASQKDVLRPAPLSPQDNLGMTAAGLAGRIGQPDFIRLEGRVLTYQYRLGGCVIDFYFVSDTPEAAETLTSSWDMRPRHIGDELDMARCERQLGERSKAL